MLFITESMMYFLPLITMVLFIKNTVRAEEIAEEKSPAVLELISMAGLL